MDRRRLLGGGAAGILVVTARGLPVAASAPEQQDVVSAIQQVLERQADARRRGDKAAFMATIDQRSPTWARIQSEAFDADRLPSPRLVYQVTGVQPKQDGYYKAWIEMRNPSGAPLYWAVWVFRQAESGWLHTEILNDQIGMRDVLETEHFRLTYFAWDEDIIQRIGGVAEQAYDAVVQRLKTVPRFKIILSVNPTYDSHPALRGLSIGALYDSRSRNTVIIRSIESFGAGLIPLGSTDEEQLLVVVTHEMTHLVNDQIVPLGRVPDWATEGLAEYVADHLRSGQVGDAVRGGKALTLDKASEIIEWGVDPAKGFTATDVSLAYGFSAYGVQFFIERFGNEKLFALERTYADQRKWPEAFAGTTGEEWGQFQTNWSAWLRRKFAG